MFGAFEFVLLGAIAYGLTTTETFKKPKLHAPHRQQGIDPDVAPTFVKYNNVTTDQQRQPLAPAMERPATSSFDSLRFDRERAFKIEENKIQHKLFLEPGQWVNSKRELEITDTWLA